MKDYIVSAAAFFLSAFVFISSGSFADSKGGLSQDPAYYPRILAGILAVMALVLLIQTLRKKEAIKISANKGLIFNISKVIAALILYIIALNILGFLIATAAFLFGGILLFGGKVKQSAILFLPITLVIYVVFSILFKMPLPKGIFFI